MKNRISLYYFFKEIKDESYCIVKSYELKDYSEGRDIDLFCLDVKKILHIITRVGQKYISELGCEIRIKDMHKHIHVDFYCENKLIIRFDLYGEMPNYSRVQVKDSYFASVIENYREVEIDFGEEVVTIHVSSEQDDLILRYIEYVEYYIIRPDKIKHLDYILNKLQESPAKISYLDRLHYYTDFPRYEPYMLSENHKQNTVIYDKQTRELLREYQDKINNIEDRYQRLLLISETDFSQMHLPSNIIIYGAGNIGKVLYRKIKKECRVECFLDLYSKEGVYEGVPIISPYEVEDRKDKIIIVVPMYDYDSIFEMLSKIYDSSSDIISLKDFCEK